MRRAWYFPRHTACVVAVLCGVGLARAAPPLPARNLSVEVRTADDSDSARSDAVAGGTVTLDSRGRIDASGSAHLRSRTQRQGSDAVQQVWVLNGGRASLRLSQAMPVDDIDIVWTPFGPAAALRSPAAEVVDGIEVAPRWPGGQAPVTLEIAAQRGAGVPQGNPPARAAQLSVFTTVQAPLGEWVEVARLQRRQAVVMGSGFGAATASRQRSLQVRVSLP